MITDDKLDLMYRCSDLLPDPGGEVARELITELRDLRSAVKAYLEAKSVIDEGGTMFPATDRETLCYAEVLLEGLVYY